MSVPLTSAPYSPSTQATICSSTGGRPATRFGFIIAGESPLLPPPSSPSRSSPPPALSTSSVLGSVSVTRSSTMCATLSARISASSSSSSLPSAMSTMRFDATWSCTKPPASSNTRVMVRMYHACGLGLGLGLGLELGLELDSYTDPKSDR